jgi:hypothetical protein
MEKDSPKGRRWSIEDTGTASKRLAVSKSPGKFDPYEGAFASKPPSRKRDLRKVQEWQEAKQRAEELKRGEADLPETAADGRARR